MGEMADFCLEQIGCTTEYGYDDEVENRPEKPKTCKFCGQKGLYWLYRFERWILGDGRGIHHCKKNPQDFKKQYQEIKTRNFKQ